MAIESVASSITASYQGREAAAPKVTPMQPAKTEAPEIKVASNNTAVDTYTSQSKVEEKGAKEKNEVSNEYIKSAVENINKNAGTEAVFGIHEQTNRVTIKIVDKETKDVIKEVPAEETLDMIAKAWELAGLFVDEKR